MLKYDPESCIFLKVFPDVVNPNYLQNKTEYMRNKLGTSLKSSPESMFALRFGAVAVTLGSTFSCHKPSLASLHHSLEL
jgi:hypothetical protein